MINCNLSNFKIIGKGTSSNVYNINNNTIIKKILINDKNICFVKQEIKNMKKVNGDKYFPKLYGIKICSLEKNPYILIKMEKLDYTLEDWMKNDHSIEEWKNIFKQIFIIIHKLNTKYRISNYDLKPDNFMFKNNNLKMIDLGKTYKYIDEINYINFINLIDNKYGYSIFSIVHYLLKFKKWNKTKIWKYLSNCNLTQQLFKKNIIDLNKIDKWKYPDKIIPFIKELQKSCGKPTIYFIEKYFQDIE